MNNDLISRDVLRKRMNQYVFPITTNNLMGAADAYYRILHIIDDLPSVKSFPSFDLSANALLDEAATGHHIRFRETDEMCPECQRDLEVYYCENRTYAVRCKHCKMVTLVQARNYDEAAEKVGLKPSRFERAGQWKYLRTAVGNRLQCDVCNHYIDVGNDRNFCPNCGTRMIQKVLMTEVSHE